MKLLDAQMLAQQLLKEHGLDKEGWRFEFDRAKNRFGVCRYSKRTIGLSLELTQLNDVSQVKDTLLHEIAHAIAGQEAGHGIFWTTVAQRIGCTSNRCYKPTDVVRARSKYEARCPQCNSLFVMNRATDMDKYCTACNRADGSRFRSHYKLNYQRTGA